MKAAATPAPGQMLLRTGHLSLDPYMRGRMSAAPSYAAPVAVDAVMEGGTVAQDVVNGLEAAPRAFIGLLCGENFGKLVIHVGAME